MPPARPEPLSAWKIVGILLSIVGAVSLLGWNYISSSLAANENQIHAVQAQVAAEKNKTDVTVTEIKGKLDAVEKNLERVEKGQEKIKEQLEKNASQQEKLNSNLEQLLRQRGRIP
jgi:septal ring factor EnvC (AmiA/AmiB activator)